MLRYKSCTLIGWLFLTFFCAGAQSKFIKREGATLLLDGKPYYFSGTNYWYGGLLAIDPQNTAGRNRLCSELDFLQAKGIKNVRVMAAVEGSGAIAGVLRIGPPLQVAPGVFNSSVLYGLDVLLAEMGKRKMKAVLMLSNNWEWSGGWLQYLRWNNSIADSFFRNKIEWETLRDEVSKFYSCLPCIQNYQAQLRLLVNRTNLITGLAYRDDPTIMAWELANEPRPMRPAANAAYLQWIDESAQLIRKLDQNHLITTGHEGSIGNSGDSVLYSQIHALPSIDYLTIHIWPKNWGWIQADNLTDGLPKAIAESEQYIRQHMAIANRLQKPLVLEEFGLPRDQSLFTAGSPTRSRDAYYKAMLAFFSRSKKEGQVLAGFNFWAFAGSPRNNNLPVFWREGDPYSGDPPMEEQGLNSVFTTDSSTWKVITDAMR